MKTRLIEESYALLKPDGKIAGDGGNSCLYGTQEAAEYEYLADDYLLKRNNCAYFRIAKIQIVEVIEDSQPVEARP